MSILSMRRDLTSSPSIVRISTSDTLSTITTSGYITTQSAVIESLNSGSFEWEDDDLIAISYSGGDGLFQRNSTTNTFYVVPLTTGSVSLSNLATGITPSHVAKFGAIYTTSGGAAAEVVSIPGVVATDIVIATLYDDGLSNVSLDNAFSGVDQITLTFSADPGTTAKVNYVIFRAAS